MSRLCTKQLAYKPFSYLWAYNAWLQQQRMIWLPEEVSMDRDKIDWNTNLKPEEKTIIIQILRLFTQSDVEIGKVYLDYYIPYFKSTEIRMMLTAFANIETIHAEGYDYLNRSLELPESEYLVFMEYQEMQDKYNYMTEFKLTDSIDEVALTMACISGFFEGMVLFSSFAILNYFSKQRNVTGELNSTMIGVGQIITWSVRDESLHCLAMIKLFHCFLEENPSINIEELNKNIQRECRKIVEMEMKFIDLVFSLGSLDFLSIQDLKDYIYCIANRRLSQLGVETIYDIHSHKLNWMEDVLTGVEMANFFYTTPTNYSKGTVKNWDNVFK